MNFTPRSAISIAGRHALLSPSSPAWVNYDEDKLERVFYANEAARRGTELHALAHDLIRLGVKLPEVRKTLNEYVNDGIGYRMTSEVILMYSDNAFGTADTIGFNSKNMFLRIHDLKTGRSQATMTQLEIYAALFCLEYKFNPNDIGIELRIYQNNNVVVHAPETDKIFHLMDKIVTFDKRITYLRMEAT